MKYPRLSHADCSALVEAVLRVAAIECKVELALDEFCEIRDHVVRRMVDDYEANHHSLPVTIAAIKREAGLE